MLSRPAESDPTPLASLTARACGAILLVAVALKVLGAPAAGIDRPTALFSPQLQVAAVQIEAVVGLWLVSGWAAGWACVAGVTLYAGLAGVSAYLAAVGQSSCGCFGRVEVSPWLTLALDVCCAAALALTRWGRPAAWHRPPARSLAAYGTGLAAVAVLMAVAATPVAGRQLARFRGDVLAIDGGGVDAGPAAAGDYRWAPVVVRNLSGRGVRLVGGTASCSCVATADLPAVVPPNGEVKVHVGVRYTGTAGDFKHRFELFTDAPSQMRLAGFLTGRVVGPAGS